MMDLNRCFSAALVCLAASLVLDGQPAASQAPNLNNSTDQINYTLAQTSSGLLKGVETRPNQSGYQSVVKFLAVPYARAPVGHLRFRRPLELPAEQARRMLDASKLGKTCPQHRHLTRFVSPLLNLDAEHQTSEDCLHLNIYRPVERYDERRQMPVIVWIPGEGFDFADARQFDGSQLALKTQSIVVTVQYRVGVLGLLDAPELGAEGNQAIHDQLLALRWVQKNIHAFNGNERRVTIMGRFSGGMSISAMLTAPNQTLVMDQLSRALFNKAVLLSGIAVDDWIIVDNQRSKVEAMLEDARAKGLCARDSSLECLRAMPAEQLLQISGYQWRLVRDNQLVSTNGGPIEALRTQSLPRGVDAVLLGETGTEGTLCLYRHMLMTHLNRRAQLIDENRMTGDHLNEFIRDDINTYFQYNKSDSDLALEMALYTLADTAAGTPNKPPHHQLRQRYLDACSGYMVKSHNSRFKRHLQQVSERADNLEVHHYQLNYKPSFSLAPDYIKTAAHGDDIPLIFGLVYNQPAGGQLSPADLAMTEKMLAFIGDFVHGRGRGERRALRQSQSVHLLDVDSTDLRTPETSQTKAPTEVVRQAGNAVATSQMTKLIIVEAPFSGEQLVSRQPRQQQQTGQQVAAVEESSVGQLTRSQKLLEMHRQQLVEDGLWMQQRAQFMSLPQSGGSGRASGGNALSADGQISAATETSLATVLLLTASIVILALMSVCVVLSVLVVRYNALGNCHDVGAGKRSRRFNSSSSCNICDDSQGGSIDAVLSHQASAKKSEHAFCNVFAKLRNGNQQNQSRTQTSLGDAAVAGRPLRTANGQQAVESMAAATPLPTPQ